MFHSRFLPLGLSLSKVFGNWGRFELYLPNHPNPLLTLAWICVLELESCWLELGFYLSHLINKELMVYLFSLIILGFSFIFFGYLACLLWLWWWLSSDTWFCGWDEHHVVDYDLYCLLRLKQVPDLWFVTRTGPCFTLVL